MPYSPVVPPLPFTADVDLSAAQYRFVTGASIVGRIKRATGASNPFAWGVLQNDPVAGDEAAVAIWGTTMLYADAGPSAIGYGDYIASTSAGLAVKQALTGSAPALAMALEAVASGSGVLFEALLLPGAQRLA